MTRYIPPTNETMADRELVSKAIQAAGLIAFVLNHINEAPPGPLPAGTIGLFLRTMIMPAEALVRRAIYLFAALLPAPKPRAVTTPRPPVRTGAPPQTPSEPRIPAFRLTEPLARPAAPAPRTAPSAPPRAAQPMSDDTLRALNHAFINRLMALRAACADPERCALRLRRRLLHNPPATRPLSDKAPAGLIRQRTATYLNLFNQLDPAATGAWPRLLDTS